jgi:hypothetical protein
MLSELLKFMSWPSSKQARQYGYLYSAIALKQRARRVGQYWAEHLAHCRKLIMEHVPKEPCRIAIFGSGPLFDIPADEILAMGHQLILVDMVHPPEVRKKYNKHSQVQLIEMDITGYVNGKGLDFLPPEHLFKADFWISANIWSQLSLEPVAHYKKKNKLKSDDLSLKNLSKKIARDHWLWFSNLPGKKLLYSDVERIYRNSKGLETERFPSSVIGVDQSPLDDWIWTICPLGEDSPDYSFDLRVLAYLWG